MLVLLLFGGHKSFLQSCMAMQMTASVHLSALDQHPQGSGCCAQRDPRAACGRASCQQTMPESLIRHLLGSEAKGCRRQDWKVWEGSSPQVQCQSDLPCVTRSTQPQKRILLTQAPADLLLSPQLLARFVPEPRRTPV